MSRNVPRKINQRPVRSPSPDIACKNVIVRSASPIQQACNISRMHAANKTSTEMAFLINQQPQKIIQNLRERYELLLKQFNLVTAQKFSLQKENIFLKDSNRRLQQRTYNFSNSIADDNLLRTYEQKLKQFLHQNKRIHQQLQKVMKQNQQQKIYIDNLRSRSDFLGSARHVRSIRPQQDVSPKSIKQAEAFLNREMSKLNQKVLMQIDSKSQELTRRIQDLQVRENEMRKYVLANKYKTPVNQKHDKQQQFSTNRKSSPDSSKFKRSYHFQDSSQTQYSKLKRQLITNQKNLEHERNLNYQLRNKLIQQERNHYQLDKNNSAFGTTTANQQKCARCCEYELKIEELVSYIKLLEAEKKSKLTQNNQTVAMRQKQAEFHHCLQDYLKHMSQLKSYMNNKEINDYIKNNQVTLGQVMDLNDKFDMVKAQNQKFIEELKRKQIQYNLQIIELKKKNKIMEIQIQQQNEHLQKLKEIISNSLQKRPEAVKSLKSKRQGDENSKFREYINQAINRIQLVQNEITKALND